MHWLGLIVAIVFLNSCFVLTINSAKSTTSLKTNDPCSKLKCNKTEVVCVEKTNNGTSFECRCAKTCTKLSSSLSLNQTQSRGVRFSSTATNKTASTLNKAKIEKLKPIAKQGGSACYPSACMNGGTCFTNTNANYYFQASQKSARSNTTPPTNYNPPLCSCTAQFTGSRCQNFKTAYALNGYYNNYQTTTTTYYLTTTSYSNNNYYNQQPVYSNNNNNQYYSSNTNNNNNNYGSNNGQTGQYCNVYNVNNQNICQNGGQCVFVSASQVACICPSTFMGQYCEIPVYNTCPIYSSGGSSGGSYGSSGSSYGSSGSSYGSSGSSYGSSGSSYGSSGSNYAVPAPAPSNNYVPSGPSYGSSGSSYGSPSNSYGSSGSSYGSPSNSYGSSGSSYGSSGSNYAVPAPAPSNNYSPSGPSYAINSGSYRLSDNKSGKLTKVSESSKSEDENISEDNDIEDSQETAETTSEKRTTTIDNSDLFAKIFSTKGNNDKVDKYGYMSSGCNPTCNNQPTLAPLPSNSYYNNNNKPSYGGYGNTLPTLAPLPSSTYTYPTLAPLPSTYPTLAPLPSGPSYYNNNNNNNNNNYNSGSSGSSSSQFAQHQCHRVNGNCQSDGSCLCNSGYTGPRCDQPISNNGGSSGGNYNNNYNYYSASVNNNYGASTVTTPSNLPTLVPIPSNAPTNCISNYCLNGGTCQTSTTDPYVICICPAAYTGQRCDINVPGPSGGYGYGSGSSSGSGSYGSSGSGSYGSSGGNAYGYGSATLVPVPHQYTLSPRCNFTITLQNDGFYTARLQVQFTLDGIVQPLFTSGSLPFIGQQASVTLPYYATDIVVIGQYYGWTWSNLFSDTGINTATRCTKCYKVWGAVTDRHWDYLLC